SDADAAALELLQEALRLLREQHVSLAPDTQLFMQVSAARQKSPCSRSVEEATVLTGSLLDVRLVIVEVRFEVLRHGGGVELAIDDRKIGCGAKGQKLSIRAVRVRNDGGRREGMER